MIAPAMFAALKTGACPRITGTGSGTFCNALVSCALQGGFVRLVDWHCFGSSGAFAQAKV